MNKLDLAASLIRPSLFAKLTDRAWFIPVLFAALILLAAFMGRMPFGDAVNAILVLVGGPAAAEKLKDAYIGGSAVRGDSPQPVANSNAGWGVAAPSPTAAAPSPTAAAPPRPLDVLKKAGKSAATQVVSNEFERATGVDVGGLLGARLGVGSPDPLPEFAEVAR